MRYYILEVKKIDQDGNLVPPSEFFVVDADGVKVGRSFDNLQSAIAWLQELELKQTLAV